MHRSSRRDRNKSNCNTASNFVVPPPREAMQNEARTNSANNTPAENLSSMSIVKRRSVSRVLFPKANDEVDTDTWLSELEDKFRVKQTKKWQFDFVKGQPLQSSTSEESPDIIWSKVAEDEVPSFYHTVLSRNLQPAPAASTSTPSEMPDASIGRRVAMTRTASISPRKTVSSSAIVTRMASQSLLPPPAAALLSAPRKVPPQKDDLGASPRKMARCDASSSSNMTLVFVGEQSRSPTKSVPSRRLKFSASNSPTKHVSPSPSSSLYDTYCGMINPYPVHQHVFHHHHCHDDTNHENIRLSPLVSVKKDGPHKFTKDHHKTPRKKR